MLSISNIHIDVNVSILNVKNYDKWWKQTKVLFDYQDVLEVIKNGVTSLVEDTPIAQRTLHKEDKTKYCKALYIIHHCVDTDNFEKVGDCTSSKEA